MFVPLCYEIRSIHLRIFCAVLWQRSMLTKNITPPQGYFRYTSVYADSSWRQTTCLAVFLRQILQSDSSSLVPVQFSRKQLLPALTSPTQSMLISSVLCIIYPVSQSYQIIRSGKVQLITDKMASGKYSPQLLALFLCEVGNCERTLQYCREILTSNSSFTPELIFNIDCPQASRTTMVQSEFYQLLRRVTPELKQAQMLTILNYFKSANQSTLHLDQFAARITAITPKLIKPLRAEFNYELRYALQRYFQQILLSRSQLEVFSRIQIPSDQTEPPQKVTLASLAAFLYRNGRNPTDKIIKLIFKEIDMAKIPFFNNRCVQRCITDTQVKAEVISAIKTPLSQRLNSIKPGKEEKENVAKNIVTISHRAPSDVGEKVGEKKQDEAAKSQKIVEVVEQRIKNLMSSLISDRKSQKKQSPRKSQKKQSPIKSPSKQGSGWPSSKTQMTRRINESPYEKIRESNASFQAVQKGLPGSSQQKTSRPIFRTVEDSMSIKTTGVPARRLPNEGQMSGKSRLDNNIETGKRETVDRINYLKHLLAADSLR